MKPIAEIESQLKDFKGSLTRYIMPLFPQTYLSEGAMYVIDACDALWLMTDICAYQEKIKKKQPDEYYYQRWTISKATGGYFKLICLVGNNDVVYENKRIESNFPLEKLVLLFGYEQDYAILCLDSEY